MCCAAWIGGRVLDRHIWRRLDKPVSEQIEGRAERANLLRLRNALLKLDVREGGIGTNCAIIDKRADGHHCCAVGDRDAGIDKLSSRVAVPHAQLGDLAESAGDRVLMAFAARLRVVDRPEAIGYVFDLIELLLIRLMSGLIDDAICLTVTFCRRLVRARRRGAQRGLHRRQSESSHHEYHDHSFHWTVSCNASGLRNLLRTIEAT